MKDKLKTSLLYGVLATTWLLVLYIAVLLLYPYHIIDVKEYTILTDNIKAGDELPYMISYCKYKDMSGMRMRAFENDIIYAIPPDMINIPVGCHTSVNTIRVPSELPPGEYKVKNTAVYRLNALRQEEVSFESNKFTVTK